MLMELCVDIDIYTVAQIFAQHAFICMVLDSHKTIEGSTAAYLAQLTSLLIIHRIGELY